MARTHPNITYISRGPRGVPEPCRQAFVSAGLHGLGAERVASPAMDASRRCPMIGFSTRRLDRLAEAQEAVCV